MTEAQVQYGLRSVLSSSLAAIPNTHVEGIGETDLLLIARSLRLYAFEVKVSRSDFKAEFSVKRQSKRWRHDNLRRGHNGFGRPIGPNHFYFAVPAGLVTLKEIPVYAGLVVCHPLEAVDGYDQEERPVRWLRAPIEIVKKAPLLHRHKLPEAEIIKMLSRMSARYWSASEKRHLQDLE